MTETTPTEVNGLNAYVTRLPDGGPDRPHESADLDARALPLANTAMAVKDVIDVAGVSASFGSRVPVRSAPAERSASLVRALQRAGASVVATTNCQEFSYGILGDESAQGRSINPLGSALVTGGSSMGSAIAVATGEVPLTLGTDTAGSVRVPAACTGVVGFKPTFGALPVEGIFPLSPSFDTPGFFARDTEVIERAFVTAAPEAAPQTTQTAQSTQTATQASAPGSGAPGTDEPLTIDLGLLHGAEFDRTPEAPQIARLARVAAEGLPGARATSGNTPALTALLDAAGPIYSVVRRYEAYRIHRPYLDEYAHLYQPGVLGKIRAGRRIAPGEYEQHLRMLDDLRRRALAETSDAQLLLTPALRGDVPTWDAVTGATADDFVRYSMPFNVLGWPAIVIPTPVTAPSGVPVALQVGGKPGVDVQVLRAAGRLLEAMHAA